MGLCRREQYVLVLRCGRSCSTPSVRRLDRGSNYSRPGSSYRASHLISAGWGPVKDEEKGVTGLFQTTPMVCVNKILPIPQLHSEHTALTPIDLISAPALVSDLHTV
ncbi:hypothetical protein AAFF_G00395020 [Aldrovandia affinis]|uniref:Uncharacterized protein n=1 Tax=Aldrovandia affinis TaxID=143900 RepID=A0AAD7SDZ4_9TELE|nr:hypothetical protein AAFF_G00395020 [Aldrovandia affinis]